MTETISEDNEEAAETNEEVARTLRSQALTCPCHRLTFKDVATLRAHLLSERALIDEKLNRLEAKQPTR